MEIKKLGKTSSANSFQEGVIFEGIKQHIKVSNFPKKLMLKKFDLIMDSYNKKIEKISKLIIVSKKTKETYLKNSKELAEKNQREKNIIMQKLQ